MVDSHCSGNLGLHFKCQMQQTTHLSANTLLTFKGSLSENSISYIYFLGSVAHKLVLLPIFISILDGPTACIYKVWVWWVDWWESPSDICLCRVSERKLIIKKGSRKSFWWHGRTGDIVNGCGGWNSNLVCFRETNGCVGSRNRDWHVGTHWDISSPAWGSPPTVQMTGCLVGKPVDLQYLVNVRGE